MYFFLSMLYVQLPTLNFGRQCHVETSIFFVKKKFPCVILSCQRSFKNKYKCQNTTPKTNLFNV
jgi:hypothetical protein